jgi:hypothetical protein
MTTTDYLRIFKSIRLFLLKDYDIKKYGFEGVTVSEKEFNKYKRFLSKAKNKFNRDEFIEYVVSCTILNVAYEDIIKLDLKSYHIWKKKHNKLTNVIECDIIDIQDHFIKPNNLKFSDLFVCKKNEHPYILKMLLSEDIERETFIALNMLIGFYNDFDIHLKDDYIWNDTKQLLNKYAIFIKLDKNKIMRRIYNVTNER